MDFRTQVDNVSYKLANGKKLTNDGVMSNRLWLNMKFQADENSSFFLEHLRTINCMETTELILPMQMEPQIILDLIGLPMRQLQMTMKLKLKKRFGYMPMTLS